MVFEPPLSTSADPHRFVILGRSKEHSDAAQTLGSMPGLQRVATVQNSAPLRPSERSRHGSSGLRDGASLLLRPWMTKVGRHRPITTVCANPGASA
ncbi:hypothetical protein B5V01_30100 [Mesorhizobium erdmanii]|uniref:Uncharacterized protein n=2 Tax=Mesorhizobium TaxID=68287 RepID=A0A3M9X8G3_9HYPH|nr:hypothetical protein DNR46_16860 [Mesorhizobium japonicum]RXT36289.1 hypothetical protein B5V01_30100 [Mesorhizobium erdmanii]